MPTLPGALHYRQLLMTNAYGPLLLTCALWEHGLLRAPPGAGPKTQNFPTTDLSSKFAEPTMTLAASDSNQRRAVGTTDTEAGDAIPNVPVVVNMSSLQGSLAHVEGMWYGGGTADDLIFHPIYAATKVALSGATMHIAREMRVSFVDQRWRADGGRTTLLSIAFIRESLLGNTALTPQRLGQGQAC